MILAVGGFYRHWGEHSMRHIHDFIKDFSHGTRLLARNPIFALTAVLSLAVGIGADTTIFTIANALLFRPAAGVEQPSRLVDVVSRRGALNDISYPNYADIRRRATTADFYAYQPVAQSASLASATGAERIFANSVTANYFAVLGTRPVIGRFFETGSGALTDPRVVVLSYPFWVRHFSKDPGVIGRILQINGRAFTVIGVAPEKFQGTNIVGTDVWMPIEMIAVMQNPIMLTNRGMGWLMMGGRLKPNVSRSQAAAELDTITGALEREYPDANRGRSLRMTASSVIPNEALLPVAGFLSLLMVIVSMVLAVACANVASVLLARASARRREIAVRLAIGAGRGRIIRQLITETIILMVLGAASGLFLARTMTSLLLSLLPVLPVPVQLSLGLDGRVIAFTIGISLVAAVSCGLVPALQASKTDVMSTLKDEAGGWLARRRLRNAFVVGQIALSIIVVIAAGLFIRALQKVNSIDLGFDPRDVEIVSVNTAFSTNTALVGAVSELELIRRVNTVARLFNTEVLERVRKLPGVQSATLATNLPMGDAIVRLGAVKTPDASVDVLGNSVEPGYFETMRIPLVAGRDFNETDSEGAPMAAIVGEAAARQFWPGENPVGKSFTLEFATVPGAPSREGTLTVIGVARDVKYVSLRDETARLFIYTSLKQQWQASAQPTIVVRTTPGRRVAADIRALIGAINPNALVLTANTLEDNMALGLLPQRLAASISGSLGIVAMFLAAIGIYGLTAFAVTQRTREIGIRMALGAKRSQVVALVLRQGMRFVVLGSAIGLVLAAAGSRLLGKLLFGLPPTDPITFVGATMLFAIVGLIACYVPVRRATRINATEALRHE
jgi:predicted permease